ncbi:MAG TPA: AbrB/MazE/SpoVT family DNA-binding domain-containing protein [Candidatus Limnocylindrales bacterium]|nr:AbrB/MazE/SpoVT family DNA-binding domain-containing protein [Candidatus Limnocylindrales bacterium]
MLSVKVSTKHQIVVPSEARARLGIEAGDRLDVRITDQAIVISKRPSRASDRMRGIAAGRGWYEPDPVTYVRNLRDEWEERILEREARLGRSDVDATSADRD